MSAYQISEPVRGETHLEGFGRVEYEFAAGVVEPSDEKEAAVLALLASVGVVQVAVAKPKGKSANKSDQPSQEQE